MVYINRVRSKLHIYYIFYVFCYMLNVIYCISISSGFVTAAGPPVSRRLLSLSLSIYIYIYIYYYFL